jgi:DNA sulfur modification protein DndB
MPTRPCIVGTMGSTTYYETTMTGRELASSVRPAMETDNWATASIEERMQRKFDIKRIRETIVPYLAKHKDRFFGSLIILVPKGSIEFEPLTAIIKDELPAAYRKPTEKMGFLTIGSGENIALDGQHRLLAFREVITGGSELGDYASKVGDDEVCVLFIEFEDPQKTRSIFNNVNRHAKPTGRSDNIVTSEDDGNAILTRRLLDTDRGAPLADRDDNGTRVEIVNWKSNTLGQNSTHLTTISTVYETVADILEFHGFESFNKKNPVAPSDKQLEDAYNVVADWWAQILTLDAFAVALANTSSVPEVRYDPSNRHSLLLRPVGQVAFVKGLILAIKRAQGKLSLAEALRRANKVDWSSPAGSVWTNTIVRADGRKMVARKEAHELAAGVIAHFIADEYMTQDERDNLWRTWNTARGKDTATPIDQLEDQSLIPEDLPAPISA